MAALERGDPNEAIRRVEAGGVGAIAVWNLSSLQQVSAPSVVSG